MPHPLIYDERRERFPAIDDAMLEIIWALDELSPNAPADIQPFRRLFEALDRKVEDYSMIFGTLRLYTEDEEIIDPALVICHPMWNVRMRFDGGESWSEPRGNVDVSVLNHLRDLLRMHSTENTDIRQYGETMKAAMR